MCAARGRAGLHLWTSLVAGNESCSVKLPAVFSVQVPKLSIGVNSVTVFSAGSPKLWRAPLNSSQWQSIALPTEGKEVKVQAVASGFSRSLVLCGSGQVYSIGREYFGGALPADSTVLSEVQGLQSSGVKQVACGLDHSLFLLNNGTVLASGWSADGQTGSGSYDSIRSHLVQVKLEPHHKVSFLATCSDSSFAVTDEGGVFAWGNNEYEQLGMQLEEPQVAIPQAVDCSSMDGQVTAIAAGGGFTAFLTCRGSVYLAGYDVGALDAARNTTVPSSLLRQIHDGAVDGKVVRLEAGLNLLLALTSASMGFIHGKVHLQNHHKFIHCHTKFAAHPDVIHLACAPLGLAAVTGSVLPEVLDININKNCR